MRIVGGSFKGRRIEPPKQTLARPTTDYAKEGLFNILQHSAALEGIRVLDLFAGTGNMSVEFLSRGAEQVISVEQDRTLFAFQQRLARDLGTSNWLHVRADVFQYLRTAVPVGGGSDIIFADPPFDLEGIAQVPQLVRERGLLAPDGLLIVEHSRHFSLSDDPWYQRTRDYGAVQFSFFAPEQPSA